MQETADTRPIGRLRQINLNELFGNTNVHLELPDQSVAIIYGANGAGKSTGMRILKHAMASDLTGIPLDVFKSARFEFASGASLELDISRDHWEERDSPQSPPRTGEIGAKMFADFVTSRTPYQFNEGVIVQADGTKVDANALAMMRRMFEAERNQLPNRDRTKRNPVGSTQRRILKPCWLIGSDRLRAPIDPQTSLRGRHRTDWLSADPTTRTPDMASVDQVAHAIQRTIGQARERARQTSERLDNDFFKRLLQAIRAPDEGSRTIGESDLQATERRLVKCALATSKLDLPKLEIEQFDATAQRLIQSAYRLYLRDLWEKSNSTPKTLEKLEYFIDTLNSHLSGKEATLSLEHGLEVKRSSDSSTIPLSRLSSGEQHLLVLFHAILFRTADDGLCLIDEPEISLNVDWQTRFIAAVEGAAQLAGPSQQFIIATHSPQLVSNHAECCIEFRGS